MAGIPPQIIDEVRFATDVVSLVSEYVTLKKSGRNFFGLCPFHSEKTPSFSVNPDKQIFHCFGCGAGGNVFAFVQKVEGVGFPEAVRVLAKRAGIALPEAEPEDHAAVQEKEALYYVNQLAAEFYQQVLWSEAGKIGREYLHQRGFEDQTLQAFGVGFAPEGWSKLVEHASAKAVNLEMLVKAGLINPREKEGQAQGYYDRFRNRVMFPIQNLSGRVVAFGGRRISDDEPSNGPGTSAKYLNSPETAVYHKGHLLYAFTLAREALRSHDRLIVVEGYLDVMRMHACGFTNTAATSGTALTEHQARLILRYTKNVVLLFDSDAAGSAATLRGADILVENGMHVFIATLTPGDDPDSFLLKRPAAELGEILDHAPALLDFKILHATPVPVPAATGATAQEHAENSTAGRVEQLRSIVETLARVNDGLERQALVHRMAEQLRVDERVLWEEISRLRRLRNQRSRYRTDRPSELNSSPQPQLAGLTGTENVPEGAGRNRTVELELIRIMILYWEAIRFIFSFMRLEDFHDPQARDMARVFHQLLSRETPLEPEELLHFFYDPAQTDFVSSVINAERPAHRRKEAKEIERDYRRWSADCLATLQRHMIEAHLQIIRHQIRSAETQGEEVMELLQQFDEYQKQLRRVKPENFLAAS
jgi:DNA primase